MPEIRYCTPALLSLIRDVVKNTNTPSWFNKKNSVPYNFGDESTGTLKADEWRSYSTVYLPLALMKAWGAGSVHDSRYEETIFRVALDHTMMLASAITLACYRRTSRERALAYRECIVEYLARFTISYTAKRQAYYVVNSHAAMHIFNFILLFGPVHSWWTFPFERLIYTMQQMNSNHKPGSYLIIEPIQIELINV